MNWLAKYGQVRNGIPFLTPAITEFHPQCDTKQATARWARTLC
jgi:hypothetical protein